MQGFFGEIRRIASPPTRGSHRQYRHLLKPGRVTVAGKPSDDLAPGTDDLARERLPVS
ncbi:type II toxin-antitoxin system HicA family toxin [Tardiphaga sp.]|uniref:type II toxin-antitoxin system HicA family toxin n=1 Tax=Tardiphaga sp. TaxID=1926292 RepID=UPI002623669E|nr:type II toxin-antitoxin system HicA family toxin [Tardiphaga sp.]